ncbi:TonB-dependent receptor [Agriterribacter sp.]|uniref:TonB-dependent receptor n=1 Tax=Agriterribacter sp. TaxID=2821509 RepID=UPI002CCB6430|nr:TonB-dependent receptor [Agriterribacter sp.]HRO46650.1 TonB-dependent receptor [Agriterribacter sp.]HRQ17311.1 TonB-dependent receptor [Agriterribacter sp.]
MKCMLLLIGFFLYSTALIARQEVIVKGRVMAAGKPVSGATVRVLQSHLGTVTDSSGYFSIAGIQQKAVTIQVSVVDFVTITREISLQSDMDVLLTIELQPVAADLSEIVVTGTMKEVSRMQSPVPVEVITPKLFQKNPTPSLFEAIGMVNGVKPQLNCNVCNTGDIHINGMEGPYTMILIDGMPIVSALSTVYGLNGIPNSIVERIEVVKGPGSSLYGSEAMGGIINVITKNPLKAPVISADIFATSWGEYSADASVKFKMEKVTGLLGINYFNYQHPADKNKDGFTDLTLQDRVSVFNKWNVERKDNRLASLALRYVSENRWGGQMEWNKTWRGSDSIYGESIYTKRWEVIGMYQLPVKEKIMTQFSYNRHQQDSWYGVTPYLAEQQVLFGQMYWDKQWGSRHDFLLGGSYRYTFYDDNTPATASADGVKNAAARTPLPGVFVQDEWMINEKSTLLAGYRYDYNTYHGNVHSPRIAYKFAPNSRNTIRASFGTGYRVVNLFTEDHAALTGAREVVITEALEPERSYNGNLNYVLKIPMQDAFAGLDITGFYSYFTNKITGDFDTDPGKIIYDNLDGHAISRGIALNADFSFTFPLKILAGVTYMNVYSIEDRLNMPRKNIQLNAPEWSGNFVVSYALPYGFAIDFTGKWDGPMRLPVLPNDYRPEYSPWFCIANLQLSKKLEKGMELYGGVKNLFNFLPKDPIMRPFDPFNKYVNDPVTNPYGYTFDPAYNYAPLQGIRVFLGMRYNLFK